MGALAIVGGTLLVLLVLIEAFETIVLPRTIKRNIRLTTLMWVFVRFGYRFVAWIRPKRLRQTLLGAFAPASLIAIVAIWGAMITFGYALIYMGCETGIGVGKPSFERYIYFSGTTFFTLGFGDFTPQEPAGKAVSVLEAATGFGFLALIISYFPVIYASFSRREVHILLLDSKAGSDPSAFELLRRHAVAKALPMLTGLLKEWESFASELMESALSYPIVAFYRSQHDSQSWLTSVTAMMDVCAVLTKAIDSEEPPLRELEFQARACFAMGRHLLVDLSYLYGAKPEMLCMPRISNEVMAAKLSEMRELGLPLRADASTVEAIMEMQKKYEPFAVGLSRVLIANAPAWDAVPGALDNWQTSAWDRADF